MYDTGSEFTHRCTKNTEGALVHRVLAVGDVNADLILTGLSRLPQSEQEALAQGFEVAVGGQTGTTARTLSSLGMSVTFVGKVGDDAYGRLAIAQLEQDGVDRSGVIIDPGLKTGITVVLSTGPERAYTTYLGSIAEVRGSDIPRELLRGADHIHVGSYYLQKNLRPELAELFREARGAGLSTSLDPGWDPADEWGSDIFDVLSYVDVFLPNEIEALAISRADTPGDALQVLAERAEVVVIKQGARGCLARNKKKTSRCPAFEVPVIDVTSAGDIFNAGFIFALLKKWELDTAVRFATACGAIAVTKAGSTGIISGLQEVEEFLASRPQPSIEEARHE
jgi:sugar/nucleoside kinase (ribokinase family)